MEEQLLNQLGNVEIPFSLLQHLELVEGTYTAVICQRKALWHLSPVIRQIILYGVAIDIGTTTVVTSLIDMMTGKELELRQESMPEGVWSGCSDQDQL